MSWLEQDLETARAALAIADWKRGLEHLLRAWRKKRLPRLAELISRVASHLPATPIEGKTVKERSAKWLEVAARKDSADIGDLLAVPWPGRWQECAPLLEALAAAPDDPRIALAVAHLVSTTPHDTWSCIAFYRPAFRLIQWSRDPRTKPLLEADLLREHSHAWSRQVRPLVYEAMHQLVDAPELTADEETAVAAIDAIFAHEVNEEKATQKSRADFLAAIYAARDDDTPRAIYADWLTERGDPRGELITLQLMANPSLAAQRRIRALLVVKHVREWAGPLDRVFAESRRVFTRGFLSSGHIDVLMEKELAHPEWALIESVISQYFQPTSLEALLAAPWLRTLRVLGGIDEPTAVRIATDGLAPQLEELYFLVAVSENVTPETRAGRERIARGFPKLKILGLCNGQEQITTYLASPLPPALERLVVVGFDYPLAEIAEVAAKLGIPNVEAWIEISIPVPYWSFQAK